MEGTGPIFDAADRVLGLVAGRPLESPGVSTRDRNDVILVAAYGRAYRCLKSVRELAGRGEADDAAALARVLISIVLRSLYIVQPDDPDERQRRLAQWVFSWRREGAAMLEELESLGFAHVRPGEAEEVRRLADDASWAGRLPGDKDIADVLGMPHFYSRVYRATSDAVHFGLGTVLGSFLEQPTSVSGEGASVALESISMEGAEEALSLAALTFGEFLERTEPIIGHGLAQEVASALVSAHEGDTQ